jgi:hypothetical protein
MYLRNVAGLRPGTTDRATFGQNFNIAIAENEEAVAEIGWPTFAVEQGFSINDDVVTIQSTLASSWSPASSGDKAIHHLEVIAEDIALGTWARVSCCAWWWGSQYPLLLISPSIASVLAADGCSKADIRKYLGDNVKVMAWKQEQQAIANAWHDYSLQTLVEEGRLPREYALSTDPERMVPAFPWPNDIGIIVTGDPTRNRTIGYAQHGRPGARVSKRIDKTS